MLWQMAIKNASLKLRDYAVYIGATAVNILIYYIFVVLGDSNLLKQKAAVKYNLHFNDGFSGAAIVLIILSLIFLSYANLFLLLRRKREIGILNTIGLSKWRISFTFFIETLILGIVSLIIGLILGILLSKLAGMILVKMLQLSTTAPILFSLQAILKTISYFGFMIIILSIGNGFLVFSWSTADLLNQTKPTNHSQQLTWYHVVLAIISLLLIISGYVVSHYFIEIGSAFNRRNEGMVGLLLLAILMAEIMGTFLFFKFGIEWLLFMRSRYRQLYYRGTRFISSTSARLNFKSDTFLFAVITLSMAVMMTILGSSALFYTFMNRQVNAEVPSDVVYTQEYQPEMQLLEQQYRKYIQKKTTTVYKYALGQYRFNSKMYRDPQVYKGPVAFVAQSQYNQITTEQYHVKKIQLKNNQALVSIDDYIRAIKSKPTVELYEQNYFEIAIKQQTPLNLQAVMLSNLFINGTNTNLYGVPIIIVSDSVYQKIKPVYQEKIHAIDFKKIPTSLENQLDKLQTKDKGTASLKVAHNKIKVLNSQTDADEITQQSYTRLTGFVLQKPARIIASRTVNFQMFIITAIALMIAVATGSMIMLKQLVNAQKQKVQFEILAKVGLEKPVLKQIIWRQNAMIFILPIALSSLHAFFALQILNIFLENPNPSLTYYICGSFLGVYLLFYLLTVRVYYGIVTH